MADVSLPPTGIVKLFNLRGQYSDLDDDPSSPDASWMTQGSGVSWYVRPSGSTYGSANGTSYADAWAGFSAIQWASISPGDTLYVAGTHAGQNTAVGASGASGSPITIASCEVQYGASTDDPGILFAGKARPAANWTDDGGGVYKITTSDGVTSDTVISEDLIMLYKTADRTECAATEDSWAKVGSDFYYNPSGAPKTLYFYMPYSSAFDFNGKSYVTLRGMKMYGASTSTSPGGVCNVADKNDTTTPTGIVIDKCTVGLARLRGIQIDPVGTMTGLTVTDCIGFDCGAFLYLVSGQGDQFTVTGNEIYHSVNYKANPIYSVGTGDENQIAFWGGCTNLLVDDNYLHDIRGMGINLYLGETSLPNMQNAVVSNNRVYLDGSDATRYNTGISLDGTNTAGTDFWSRFSNATISGNEVTGANTSAQANRGCAIRIKSGTPPNGTTDAPKITGNTLSDNLVGIWFVNNSLSTEHSCVTTGNTISSPKTDGYFIRVENGSTYTYLDIDENTYTGAGKWQWDGGADIATFNDWKVAVNPRDANSTYEA